MGWWWLRQFVVYSMIWYEYEPQNRERQGPARSRQVKCVISSQATTTTAAAGCVQGRARAYHNHWTPSKSHQQQVANMVQRLRLGLLAEWQRFASGLCEPHRIYVSTRITSHRIDQRSRSVEGIGQELPADRMILFIQCSGWVVGMEMWVWWMGNWFIIVIDIGELCRFID